LRKLFNRNRVLYLITDTETAGLSHIQITRQAIAAGIRTIQLREKNLSRKDLYKVAVAVKEITRRNKATFIMNDYVDIALSVNADGIHLGQDDMPIEEARRILGKGKIIGISTHSLKQAKRAQTAGADYIGFGPMYHTVTKNAGRPRGIRALRSIRENIHIPIVAIGGISWENVNAIMANGADAFAVASGILSGDIYSNVKQYMEALT
jgi:thiamine-phosphate pyrophosphorylase